MSDLISSTIIVRLRAEASALKRSKLRQQTLNQLEEACNAIASGDARKIVRSGNPDADVNFSCAPVQIRPPRVEEYVIARRNLDQKNSVVPSTWTGPMASTIRKEGNGMLAYVRARAAEQTPVRSGKAKTAVEEVVERAVDDQADKMLLRRKLDEGRLAILELAVLRRAILTLVPGLDIERLIKGEPVQSPSSVKLLTAPNLPPGTQLSAEHLRTLKTFLGMLRDNVFLSERGLNYDGHRVMEPRLGAMLVSPEVFAVLDAVLALLEIATMPQAG